MPVNFPNFLAAQLPRGPQYNPDYSGIANFIPQALQAYRAPFAMQEERGKNLGEIEKRRMENALLKEYGPREKESEIASRLAYAQSAMSSPFGRLMMERQNIIDREGADSPNAKLFEQALRKQSGFTIPAATQNRQINSLLARKERTFLQDKVELPKEYLGAGAEKRFFDDLREYQTTQNPERKTELRARLAHAATARKLVPDYAISIISAQGNTVTEGAKKHQVASIEQGWPAFFERAVNNLPEEILEEANRNHNSIIDQFGQIREKSLNDIFQKGLFSTIGSEDEFNPSEYAAPQIGENNLESRFENSLLNEIKNKYRVNSEMANDIAQIAKEENISIEQAYNLIKGKL